MHDAFENVIYLQIQIVSSNPLSSPYIYVHEKDTKENKSQILAYSMYRKLTRIPS